MHLAINEGALMASLDNRTSQRVANFIEIKVD